MSKSQSKLVRKKRRTWIEVEVQSPKKRKSSTNVARPLNLTTVTIQCGKDNISGHSELVVCIRASPSAFRAKVNSNSKNVVNKAGVPDVVTPWHRN